MATANHQKLTKTLLGGLVAPAAGKRQVIYDTETPKLAMRMTHTGVRAFSVVKRMGGVMVWLKLGTFPDMTCEQARNEAGKVLGEFAKGENPAAVKRAVKAELTFGEAFDDFLERKRKQDVPQSVIRPSGITRTCCGSIWTASRAKGCLRLSAMKSKRFMPGRPKKAPPKPTES